MNSALHVQLVQVRQEYLRDYAARDRRWYRIAGRRSKANLVPCC